MIKSSQFAIYVITITIYLSTCFIEHFDYLQYLTLFKVPIQLTLPQFDGWPTFPKRTFSNAVSLILINC